MPMYALMTRANWSPMPSSLRATVTVNHTTPAKITGGAQANGRQPSGPTAVARRLSSHRQEPPDFGRRVRKRSRKVHKCWSAALP